MTLNWNLGWPDGAKMALDPRFGRPDGVKMALDVRGAALTARRNRIEKIKTQLVDRQIALKIWEALFYHDPHCRPYGKKIKENSQIAICKIFLQSHPR